LIVGAIGADYIGVPEVQSIYCNAHEGYFKLKFRGWETGLLSYNISRIELYQSMINSDSTEFSNLYSIENIAIDDWGSSGLCSNNTARITFYKPSIVGNRKDGSNFEILTVSFSSLRRSDNSTGIIITKEVQAGNIMLSFCVRLST
jgi:hypothetical protein